MPKKEQNKETKPIVYSALEVANICGVVNQTAINWINTGHLKAFKTPGGQYRVYPEDLLAFMKERKMYIPQTLLDSCNNTASEKTLLVIDDDVAFNTVVVKFISERMERLKINSAHDGFEAGVLMSSTHPRCIVLDIDLPGVNGIELCRKIHDTEVYGKPKIIVVTGLQDTEVEQKVRDLGVDFFFRKPLQLADLHKAVEEALA
ncbi:MAG: response regulator [Treponema sp.]|nr:response regulator [Treponema sp.]